MGVPGKFAKIISLPDFRSQGRLCGRRVVRTYSAIVVQCRFEINGNRIECKKITERFFKNKSMWLKLFVTNLWIKYIDSGQDIDYGRDSIDYVPDNIDYDQDNIDYDPGKYVNWLQLQVEI